MAELARCERFGVLPRAGGLDDQTTRLYRLLAAERVWREVTAGG